MFDLHSKNIWFSLKLNECVFHDSPTDRKHAKHSPSWDQLCTLEMIVAALKPFASLTDMLSASKVVSINKVWGLLLHIKAVCSTEVVLLDGNEVLVEAAKRIRTAIWDYIDQR